MINDGIDDEDAVSLRVVLEDVEGSPDVVIAMTLIHRLGVIATRGLVNNGSVYAR